MYIFHQALHIAVQSANLPVIKVLLSHSDIDIYAINSKYVNFFVNFCVFLIFKIS